MAAIEKVCEYSGDYPGWLMYGYKRNHIQVDSKYRKEFRGLKATLVINKTDELYHVAKKWITQVQYECVTIEAAVGEYQKIRGKWYVWRQDRNQQGWIFAKRIRVLPEYRYVLSVTHKDGVVQEYINWSFEPTQVIRRMKRLVGTKNLTVKRE